MTNPVIDSAGAFSRSVPVTLTLYSGTTVSTRGVVKAASASPGEVESAWADSGPVAWVNYSGDPDQIEFLDYDDPVTDDAVRRRAVFRERVAGSLGWQTVRVVMQGVVEAGVQPPVTKQDFSPLDFGPDFG